MRRVVVVGNSGAGKSTVAAALAGRLDAPHVELDGIFHQPGWTPMPREEFRERVAAVVAGDRWVVDGNYSSASDIVWERADTVVWVDPPRLTVTRRIIGRTLRRMASRQELWNGNRERWRNLFSLDPQQSVIVWSVRRHHVVRERYAAAQHDPQWTHLRFVRLRTSRDVAALLDAA